ncbi:hypothetical protein [Jiangella mangrovi]|uniref:Uncharacterized protein n=1 Tax=Jiangella mangrovi TaxID=1524084 RepID=A0A7W9LQ35_9ACTN|nr:hypothetical protein [Jiangella mangrovi]MBB5791921.1 hypothetical protein [Jiangella mangrovi]
MSEPRDLTATTDIGDTPAPPALIVLGTPDGATDAGECADGFCAV